MQEARSSFHIAALHYKRIAAPKCYKLSHKEPVPVLNNTFIVKARSTSSSLQIMNSPKLLITLCAIIVKLPNGAYSNVTTSTNWKDIFTQQLPWNGYMNSRQSRCKFWIKETLLRPGNFLNFSSLALHIRAI